MEFGLNVMSSTSADEVTSNHTEQQSMTSLSDSDMALLSSLHCSLFIHLASSNWFVGDKTQLPKVNIIWPYILGYRAASVLIRQCAHVLGK